MEIQRFRLFLIKIKKRLIFLLNFFTWDALSKKLKKREVLHESGKKFSLREKFLHFRLQERGSYQI